MTAIVAVSAAALGVAIALIASRYLRLRADRRMDALLTRVDEHMGAISRSVSTAVERSVEIHEERRRGLPLTLDFGELVEALVTEAATRAEAAAVVVRVDGPGGQPATSAYGAAVDDALLETTLGPQGARPSRATTMDWTYDAPDDPEDGAFRSALVVPIVESDTVTGAIAAFAATRDAFGPEIKRALTSLSDEAGPVLAQARRFSDVESRVLVDAATGVPNRRGYEVELAREVARARRTGRPLSLLILSVGTGTTSTSGSDGGVAVLVDRLARTARTTDVACRRDAHQLAVLLPETQRAGADRFASRLRAGTQHALEGALQPTFAVGIAEWRPSESIEDLDARAAAALEGAATPVVLQQPPRLREAEALEPVEVTPRPDVLEALARSVDEAHRHDRTLALLVLDVDDLAAVADRHGPDAAADVVTDLSRRLNESLGEGAVRRIGVDAFAVILSGATIDDAEALLGTVQASLHERPPPDVERITLSAGITGLTETDDAGSALGRAEQALWQAKQAGRGTVVIAMTNPGNAS